MASDRFDHLESPHALPENVKAALKKLNRFEHLEIGARPAAQPAAAEKPAVPGPKQRLCPRCAQANEPERATCWACFKPLEAPKPDAAQQDITLVIDGKTHKSTDKDLPDDVAMLMKRIQTEGYSEGLLAEWRSWRATRRSPPPPTRPFEQETRGEDTHRDIKVFKGQRVSVLRLDGKVYTSDDPGLSPEMKEIFAYVEREGVTPELMESLRQRGDAKFRPQTTALPSDGDLAFWKDVGAVAPHAAKGSAPAEETGNSALIFLAVAAVIYIVLRMLSCR